MKKRGKRGTYKTKGPSGHMVSLYLPHDKIWILDAILEVQRTSERRGVHLTRNQFIVRAIEQCLPYDESYRMSAPRKKIISEKKNRTRLVVCRESDDWLMDAVDKIVQTKIDIGLETNYSYELYRLVKVGLTNTLYGESLDRLIFEVED